MENKTERKPLRLWLPTGYGRGTIVYDLDDEAYEATEKIIPGITSIYTMVPVSKEYAAARIRQGAKKLVSE